LDDSLSIIFSNGRYAAGVDCREGSNLTFEGSGAGSLTVEGSDFAPGIGPGGESICGSLIIQNGTYEIATNRSDASRSATVGWTGAVLELALRRQAIRLSFT
jgi:hypothetical protein